MSPPWFPHHQPSSSSSVSVLKTLIWSPSLQRGIATNFGGTSGISHMFLWFFFFFLYVLMLVVFLWDGFFFGGGCIDVGCFLFKDCDFIIFIYFIIYFFVVGCLVLFYCEIRLSFQKKFAFHFFNDKHRSMTKGLSWWEMWKKSILVSLIIFLSSCKANPTSSKKNA